MFGKKTTGDTTPKPIATTQINNPVQEPIPAIDKLPQPPAASLSEPPMAQQAPATQAPAAQAPAAQAPVTQPAAPAVNAENSPFLIPSAEHVAEKLVYTDQKLETDAFKRAKSQVFEVLVEKFNFNTLNQLPRDQQIERINQAVTKTFNDLSLPLSSAQLELMKKQIVDDAKGFGPLEKLLKDEQVSDIMINTANQVFIEKKGKIYLTDLTFASEAQLLNIIQKIVSQVGRRVDEASPMVDARMPDGSRFNAIIPPLAIDGALVSIRKFKQTKMGLDDYIDHGSMSENMCRFLKVCAASRASIVISGGTGSGKTTLLNALSAFIDAGERVITIEDAAELQLKQPHVLRLETRPPNIEGIGQVDQRALLRNALRMRPDRIILGEIRGDEVIDVLQAMNTGHEGSMATIHANSPRDALTRIENLCNMSGVTIPSNSLRQQIATALNLVVQVSRMRDGVRRVTSITEIVRLETDTILSQEIFYYEPGPMGEDGKLKGRFKANKFRPSFAPQVDYFGLGKELERSLGLIA